MQPLRLEAPTSSQEEQPQADGNDIFKHTFVDAGPAAATLSTKINQATAEITVGEGSVGRGNNEPTTERQEYEVASASSKVNQQ